jgi:hypothetical protein
LGDVYLCDVVVPPVPECGTGEFRIKNNGIRFKIEYMNGETSKNKFIETPFPDVTVGSFVCGNLDCEEGLGELGKCCYDCGCSSGYCDYKPGAEPSSADCKSDLTSWDIYAESVDPTHFESHEPGNQVFMSIVFGNAPKSLSIEDVSCEMGCEYGETGECDAVCSVGCNPATSLDPEKYNLSCTLSFTVIDYDNLKDYILSPSLTFEVMYRNGTSAYIEKSLNKTFNQISIGAHWCGNRDCGTDEAYESCCYDCPCPGGQYCDTQNLDGPTQGDACKSLDFNLVIDHIGSLELEDSAVEHEVPVLMHLNKYPSGIAVAPECYLADGGVSCSITCQLVPSSVHEEYNMSCIMTVPAIDYVISPHYDPDTREISLSPNRLNVSVYYNNGPNKAEKSFVQDMGEVVIKVIGHCGEGGCEDWLNEDQTNCCRDCGCDDFGDNYFCFLGGNPNGECLDNSTINLRVVGFEPDPPECIIGRIGGNCKFIKTHVANLHIVNSPPDLDVLDAFYQIEDENQTVMDCIKTLEYGNWSCPFTPSPIESSSEGISNRTFSVFMSVAYTLNATVFRDNLSTSTSFETHMKKSDALISCEDEMERIQEQINRLMASQHDYDDWGWLYYVLGAILIIIGIILIIKGYSMLSNKLTYAAGVMLIALGISMIATGTTYIILGTQSQDKGASLDLQIAELYDMMEQQREICSSEDFEEMSEATEGMEGLSDIV